AERFAQVTLKLPFMIGACGSQTYLYSPFLSVTFHFIVPVNETPVLLFTPGPFRWKLCIGDLSCTTIRYLPCFSFFTFAVPFFSVMVKLGPTTAVSFTGAADAAVTTTSAAITAASSARRIRDIVLLDERVDPGKLRFP